MRSRKFIVGALGVGVLTLVPLVAAVAGNDQLAGAGLALLLGVTALLSLAAVIVQRRTGRQTEYIYRKGVPMRGGQASGRLMESLERGPAQVERSPAVQQEDLVGMVRLMQAQYIGRLDRAQRTLEQAASRLAGSEGAGHGRGQDAVLTVPEAREAYVPAVDAALRSGVSVVVTASGEDARQWVQTHGWGELVTMSERRPAGPPAPADVREP